MNYNKKKLILFLKISLVIKNLIFNKFISIIYLFNTYLNYNNEIKKIETYLEYCNELKTIQKFIKIISPKVSIISPNYNREKFISRFVGSIQNQNFKNIELIFVDDNSFDNSVKLIEQYKKEDNRIRLIKNTKNRGTFVARNLGVLISRGKYIMITDPDDILSKEIIGICYKYANKYNYDIIRFNIYLGNGKITTQNFSKFQRSRPIYQPELSTYAFYGNNELEIIDFHITNKLIKKTIYIKSLNSLNNFYLNMYMTSMEDSLMNYLLLRTAKSFYYINKIGYLYKKTSESISNNLFTIPQKRLKFIFIYLKFNLRLTIMIKLSQLS